MTICNNCGRESNTLICKQCINYFVIMHSCKNVYLYLDYIIIHGKVASLEDSFFCARKPTEFCKSILPLESFFKENIYFFSTECLAEAKTKIENLFPIESGEIPELIHIYDDGIIHEFFTEKFDFLSKLKGNLNAKVENS